MPTDASPTVQFCALRMLRYSGITQLAPQPSGSELVSVGPGDLDDVANALSAGLQDLEAFNKAENRAYPMSGHLHAPTTVTVSVTQFSNGITFSGFQPWMTGCTIRIGTTDQQDNYLINGQLLERPYMGPTASNVQATVYGDAIALDSTVDEVFSPVELPNQLPLVACTSWNEYISYAGAPLITDAQGKPAGMMFFYYYRKFVYRPMAWYVQGFYDPTLASPLRRLRFAPMPDIDYPVAFRVTRNPTHFTAEDIDNGDHVTDPGTVIPIPSGWTESLLLPFALARYADTPSFKNESLRASIMARRDEAKLRLQARVGQISLKEGRYVG